MRIRTLASFTPRIGRIWLVLLSGPLFAGLAVAPSAATATAAAARPTGACICGLGWSVAISGTVAAAGATGGDNQDGATYMYVRAGKSWRKQAIVNNPDPGSDGFGDNFGELVALSGPNLMVAASASGSKDVSGLVDAFGWTGKKWRWLAKLVNPLGANDSRHFFGVSIAMSGSTAMIGDIGANSAGSAAVYLYRRTGTSWHQEGAIPKPPGADGRFGWSVAVSGGTAVIGDPGTHGGAGSAYVYVRSGAVWRKRAVLTDPGRAKDDYFGYTVSASGSTLVVAAPWADNIAGLAYVYEPNGRSWSMRGKLVSPHPEHLAEFGRALAVSGSRVLVGVPVRGGGRKRCGTAYLYAKSPTSWRLREQIVDPGCSYNDKFGFAVALQDRTAVIGAPLENQADGAAYVITVP